MIVACKTSWNLRLQKNFYGIKYIKFNIYRHHHVVPLARISLTLSRHFSLSFITSDRSSGLHPVSSHSCWMYVRAGRPAFARPYVGVHRSTSLMSSSLLLQQCPAWLFRLTWIVFVMGGRWPYSWCLVGCCRERERERERERKKEKEREKYLVWFLKFILILKFKFTWRWGTRCAIYWVIDFKQPRINSYIKFGKKLCRSW